MPTSKHLLLLSLDSKRDLNLEQKDTYVKFSLFLSPTFFRLLAVSPYSSILDQRAAALESNPLSLFTLFCSLPAWQLSFTCTRSYFCTCMCVCVGEPWTLGGLAVHNLISLANKATHLLLFTSVINSTSFQASSAINKLPLWEPENIVNS